MPLSLEKPPLRSRALPRSRLRLSLRKTLALLLILFLTIYFFFYTRSPYPTDLATSVPRIAIITFITNQPSYLHQSLRNKWHYARKHGYELVIDFEEKSKRGTMWLKFDMMERLIKGGKFDWIWWMDFDTLITNSKIKITDVIADTLVNGTIPADEVDFILSRDCNDFNAGSMLVRSHPRSLAFLNKVRAYHDYHADAQPHEQESMRLVLKSNPKDAARVAYLPQKQLNSFPEEIKCLDSNNKPWSEGDLLLHFAGAWAHVQGDDPTGTLMKKYERFGRWEYEELPPPMEP